jgi:hypothetical protein
MGDDDEARFVSDTALNAAGDALSAAQDALTAAKDAVTAHDDEADDEAPRERTADRREMVQEPQSRMTPVTLPSPGGIQTR